MKQITPYIKTNINEIPPRVAGRGRQLGKKLANISIECIQEVLDKNNINATGNLRDSFYFRSVDKTPFIFSTTIRSRRRYWKHVETGLKKPHFTPPSKLIPWIKAKGVHLFDIPDTQRGIRRLAWAIAIKHSMYGIPAHPYIEDSIKLINQRIKPVIKAWKLRWL